MTSNLIQTGHSAEVQMRLFTNGSVLAVAQLGPDFVILESAPTAHPAGSAEIELEVDGDIRRFAVNLPLGLTAGEKRIPISPAV
jgi:hypothetical protein